MENLNPETEYHTYKISAVSYLNSKPFLYGLENTPIKNEIILTQDSPAQCAQKLSSNEVDIGLIPVAIIPTLKNPKIIAPYCIGADGAVSTVCLFSEVPIEQIETIYLDYQSRTSVQLVQILMEEYWGRKVHYANAFPGYEGQIQASIAGVIIGDRAIYLKENFKYVYDLAEIWKLHTGMPFVFAAWVSCNDLDKDFLKRFSDALQFGLEHRTELYDEYRHLNNEKFSVETYLSKNIQFELTEDKRKALNYFLQKIDNN